MGQMRTARHVATTRSGMVKKPPAVRRAGLRAARPMGNHHLQSLLGGARIGRRNSSQEQEAHARSGTIADALAPLASAPRPAGAQGMALPHDVADEVGARLGSDLSHVRLHDDPGAARSASARAFTLGGNVVFGRGEYEPHSRAGRQLIAHELVHAAHAPHDNVLRREPDGPQGVVRMHFDGRELIVYDGETEKFRFRAESGRPVMLRSEDVKACGGDPVLETYMNNKRFVGIEDFGPIPEGTYSFSPKKIQNFTLGEQLEIMSKGLSHAPTTTGAGVIGGGDWGEGRVALKAVSLREGECGSAKTRHSFYLHGGWAGGSSGCIDIGTDFSTVAEWLADYKGTVKVTVKYEHSAPWVRGWTGFTGSLAYWRFGLGVEPSLGLGAEFQDEETRFLIQPQVDAVLKWAGGALKAGVRLEIPLNDKEQFVRLGLGGGFETRLFHALYAQLYGGYSFALTDPEATSSGAFLGTGLHYDFGPAQLGVVYDHLWATKNDPEAHRVFAKLGLWLF